MSDDDDSDDDLWADLDDEDETTITVSENLKDSVSAAAAAAVPIIHQGDVDEGKVTWIAPSTNGLHNSLKVNEAAKMGRHWFNEGFQPGQEEELLSRGRRPLGRKPSISWQTPPRGEFALFQSINQSIN